MLGLPAITGRPRFHRQVEVGEGAGSGRGGVMCISLGVESRVAYRELLLLARVSVRHMSIVHCFTPLYVMLYPTRNTGCDFIAYTSRCI